MSKKTIQTLTFVLAVTAVLATPTESFAACRLFDCMFGTTPAPASVTTYAPPYVPAPAYSSCAAVAPSCSPCAPTCVPQTCEYAPAVAYRPYAAYSPVVAGATFQSVAYQPVVGSYTVSRYRPYLGTYDTRLVPYTTYRAYPVTYYAPTVAYSAAYAYVPAVGCGPCGVPSYGSCATGSCGGVVYGDSSSGCSSCGVPSATLSAPPADTTPKPTPTFQQGTNKPIPDPGDKTLAPIPANNTNTTTLPQPTLRDPNDRTTMRQLPGGANVQFAARPAKPAPVEVDADGWHAPRDAR